MIMEIAKLSETNMEAFRHFCSDFLNDSAYVLDIDAREILNIDVIMVPDDAAWGRIETVLQNAFKHTIETKRWERHPPRQNGLPNWWDAIGALVYLKPDANSASQLKKTQEIYRASQHVIS